MQPIDYEPELLPTKFCIRSATVFAAVAVLPVIALAHMLSKREEGKDRVR